MGWHEWPLMVFTVFGQVAVGGLLVLSFALLSGKVEEIDKTSITKSLFFVWVLLGIGFLASTFHLGSPLRGINALNRIGSSGLSTEVACGIAFFALGGLYWLLAVMGKLPAGLKAIWLAVVMILGVVFVYSMVNAYKINTVPTWDNCYTTVNFFMTMLIGGAVLGYLLKRPVCECGGGVLALIALAAFVVSIMSNLMQSSELATISSASISATALSPDFGMLMALRVLLVAIGLILWIAPMLKGKATGCGLTFIALLFVLAGELVGRGVFYGLHMTVGMTYGG